MKVRDALAYAAARLAETSETARLDAELLMAHALGVEREKLLLSCLDQQSPPEFEPLAARRQAGEPVAYIIESRAFWTIELKVGQGVLIPRPDSETLIEAAVVHFGSRSPATILDLGTGPGSLLLAALDQWPNAKGLGIDASRAALDFAEENARLLDFSDRAEFRLGNWADGLSGSFDLILCNPPYVEAEASLPRDVSAYEPSSALFAGQDGLDDYRLLAPHIPRLLTANSIACIEIGAGQEEAVRALFSREGLRIGARKDLGGHVRCLTLQH